MPLDTRDKSILTQVAFKGAVDHTAGLDVTTDEGRQRFGETFGFFVNELFAVAQQVTAPQQQQQQRTSDASNAAIDAESRIVEEFDATPVDGDGYELRVKGDQHGPLPPWLIEQAAAKGVREVWDNRGKIASGEFKKNSPHFKSTDDANVPFWPPKEK